ncbi:hydroxymethylpyrimidine kinase / phosphohydroxymethylpyrimidine kinase [Campylobacter hyointestinalis subsp. lawsonii CCUG 27631]|uniref:bifunctional hydroxymethylpyrimidine kinase/phosphomethylpyrimidine kinase n=1 Tax=Campylobacter hyointestinalis TaxID=198 RepID=UPI0007C8C50E|nr:bifunctional hydroxymethylpyrimidine kinase/phosphomethylpyrimidine kinase [Campylobacter hyointestinalis]ANE34187.1 hydroxymethylpyrimidine kinase / phosphohydroxymethylpyrimidine kinase [Campylobacter hyointestinalis subsp. lawsonii CCUG 27631]
MKKILTIAGSDSSGGAGVQADIKTITAHKMYAMSAITALTAQNTKGVSAVSAVSGEFVFAQIKAVFDDIVPDALKIGMLFNAEIIEAVRKALLENNAKNVVCDTVMIATSGAKLLEDDAIAALWKLFELSSVITPNIAEASVLAGFEVRDIATQKDAAKAIYERCGTAVLVKGGHLNATDILWDGQSFSEFEGELIATKNTHGTGCTLSSAIACGLATGLELKEAIKHAKSFINKALSWNEQIGHGNGAIDHYFNIKELI